MARPVNYGRSEGAMGAPLNVTSYNNRINIVTSVDALAPIQRTSYIEAHTSPRFSFLWPHSSLLASLEESWRERNDGARERRSERESFLIWMRGAGADDLGSPLWGVLGIPTILAVRSRVYKRMDIGGEREERGILKYRMEYVNGGREGFFDSRWDHRVLSGDIYMAPWILSSLVSCQLPFEVHHLNYTRLIYARTCANIRLKILRYSTFVARL